MNRIALLTAGVVFLAAPAQAAGTFDLSWDGCTGPIVKAIAPGTVSPWIMLAMTAKYMK